METAKKKAIKVDVAAEIRKSITTEAEKIIPTIPSMVHRYIEAALLSLLGLENRSFSQRMEIDHCNGRNSVLIDAFRKIAIGEAEKIARAYKPSPQDAVAFKTAFAEEYGERLRRAMSDIACNRARAEAEVIGAAVASAVNAEFGIVPEKNT
jgi:hypothetical protein